MFVQDKIVDAKLSVWRPMKKANLKSWQSAWQTKKNKTSSGVGGAGASDFCFLLTECTLPTWYPCVMACICAFVLSSVLARS